MSELLYTKLGIDPSSLEGLTEEKAVEIASTIESGIRSKILESEDFYKTLDENKIPSEYKNKYLSEGTSKIAGIAKKTLDKEFALTQEDKSKFGEEDLKNIDKYISKVKEIYSGKVNAGNNEVGNLQNENLTLKQSVEEYKGQLENLTTEYELRTADRLKQKDMESLTMLEVIKLSGQLMGNIGATFKLVYPSLTEKYALVEEGGIPSIRKKDNPAFKVEFDNAGKKEHLSLNKALELEYKALGLWKETEEKSNPQTITINTDFMKKTIPENIQESIRKERAFLES
ncbi:hypothetical protein [Chryseobacterium potabilaquae]|uniref:Uncharacterized protein n=1 Tax=Chryseobacterium potabilaquae TaxID=2675057 RepID=A0A6N4XDS0_9FLAO|nr:hypothetical protein [Chryseobacterium potabilaquae]CAA7196750.1 hypothetical protein CHRY9293_02825 [Chryseobacterium potabilaquae]